MYKTIIVHVDESPLTDARVRAAAWLAGTHEAHLVGCAATGMSWPAYAMLTGSMAVTPVHEFDTLRSTARANLARFAERARQLGVESHEERLVEDENRDALLLQARYADLVVTGAFGHSRYREIVLGGVTRVLALGVQDRAAHRYRSQLPAHDRRPQRGRRRPAGGDRALLPDDDAGGGCALCESWSVAARGAGA